MKRFLGHNWNGWREWLERLAASYEEALPDDADVVRALFPEIVGAVANGRVADEMAVR